MQSVMDLGSSNTAQDLRSQRMEGSIGSMQSMLQRLLKDTSDLTASHSSLLEFGHLMRREEQQVQKLHIRDAGCQTQDSDGQQKAAFQLEFTQQHNHTEHAEIVWEEQQISQAAGPDCPARVLAYHVRHSSYHKRRRSVSRTCTTTQEVTGRAAAKLPKEKQGEPQPVPSFFAVDDDDDETQPPNETYLPEARAPCSKHITAAADADHDHRPLVLSHTIVREVVHEVEAIEEGQDVYQTVLNGAIGHQGAKDQRTADNKRAKKLPAPALTAPCVLQARQSTITCSPQALPNIPIKAQKSSPGLAQQLADMATKLDSTGVPSHTLAMIQQIDDRRDKAGASTGAHGAVQVAGSRAAGHVLTRQGQASAQEAGKKRAAAAYDFVDDDEDGQPCKMMSSLPEHIKSQHHLSNKGRGPAAISLLGNQTNQSACLASNPLNTSPLPLSPTGNIACSLFHQSSTVFRKASPADQQPPQQVSNSFDQAEQHHRLHVPAALASAPEQNKSCTSLPYLITANTSHTSSNTARKPGLDTAFQFAQTISQPTYQTALGASTTGGKEAKKTAPAPRLQVTPFTGLLRGHKLVPGAQASQLEHQKGSDKEGQHVKSPVPCGLAPVRPASKGAKPVQKQVLLKPQPAAAICYSSQSEGAEEIGGWVQVGKGVVKGEDAIARAVAQKMKRHRERNRKNAQQRTVQV